METMTNEHRVVLKSRSAVRIRCRHCDLLVIGGLSYRSIAVFKESDPALKGEEQLLVRRGAAAAADLSRTEIVLVAGIILGLAITAPQAGARVVTMPARLAEQALGKASINTGC